MAYLRLDLKLVFEICQKLQNTFSLDKTIAYRVFKETEDDFSVAGYLDDPKPRKESECIGEKIGLKKVLISLVPYMEVQESVQFLLLSKEVAKKLKVPVLNRVLLGC